MSLEELEKHAYYEDPSNPAEDSDPANGEEVDDKRNKKMEEKEESNSREKDSIDKTAKKASALREEHVAYEAQSRKTEHPTPDEILALAFVPDKPKNSDTGSAMRVDGVGNDTGINV